MYIWGGGWYDSTRIGVSPTWQSFYLSQTSSYNYNNYRDLSTANRAKGLDCSGFVGWAAQQVMRNGNSYTVVSGEIGSYYKNTLKWGTYVNQNYLSQTGWKVYPGDIGYDDGHTWIVLGQCSDKSAVIVHSTPNADARLQEPVHRMEIMTVRQLLLQRSTCPDMQDIRSTPIVHPAVTISEEEII